MEGPRRSKRKAANRQEYNQQQALEHVIGGKRFYSLLGVDPTYTARDIHKAYHELAGRYRPTDTAFLARLREAYEILVNPKSKALYDEACKFCTEKMGRGSWKFRTQNLARCYRGSSVEQEDVLQAYNETKGDMNKLLQSVMFSTWRDKPRFISTIQEGIVNKELEAYDKFKQTIAKDGCRLRQQKEEGEEEEEEEKEEGQEEEEEQEQEQGEKKRRKRKERAIKGRRNGSATTIRRSTTKKRRMSKSKETH